MDWFERDFDLPAYFEIYEDKEAEAASRARAGRPAAVGPGGPVAGPAVRLGAPAPALEAAGYGCWAAT